MAKKDIRVNRDSPKLKIEACNSINSHVHVGIKPNTAKNRFVSFEFVDHRSISGLKRIFSHFFFISPEHSS